MLRYHLLFITIFLLLWGVSPVGAQDGVCTALVEQAIEAVGTNCDALGRNTACYGYDEVEADFVPDVEQAPIFASPADTSALDVMSGIRTATYDDLSALWGVAVINAQLDLPETLPGQGVIMLVMGGAEVTDDQGDLPMQAFTFRSGLGISTCEEAPSALAIRNPQGTTIEMTVNGVDIVVGSTIVLTGDEDQMTIGVHEGQVTLPADDTTIGTGQALDMTMDDEGQVQTWDTPRDLAPEETVLISQFEVMFEAVGAPQVIATGTGEQRYTVQAGDNLFRIALENGTCVSELARVNGISSSQINAIPVGLELTIPDGTTCGSLVNDVPNPNNLNPTAAPNAEPNETAETGIACEGLQPTSPTAGLPLAGVTFYWDGIAAAEQYGVSLYKEGQLVLDSRVPAPQTSLSTTLVGIPTGVGEYYWTVTAFVGGEAVCSANTGAMLREWPDTPDDNPNEEDIRIDDTLDDVNEVSCDEAELETEAMNSCYAVGLYEWDLDKTTCTFECR